MISPVLQYLKFYGESESVNQNIDLYTKIIVFDQKMRSKIVILWGVPPPIYTRADYCRQRYKDRPSLDKTKNLHETGQNMSY